MRSFLKLAAAVSILSLVMTAPGCPGTDILKVDTGGFLVTVEVPNPGGTRYESATFQIAQLEIRPQDPSADAALGPEPLGTLQFPVLVDLNQPSAGFPTVPLHSGQYRIVGLELQNILLVDLNPPTMSPVCIEQVFIPGPACSITLNSCTSDIECPSGETCNMADFSNIPDARFNLSIGIQGRVNFQNLGDPVFFLPADGGTLTIQIDAVQFVAAFESALTCVPEPDGDCGSPANPIPSNACLTAFSESAFTSASQNFLSFN